jgi:hypothetical protein
MRNFVIVLLTLSLAALQAEAQQWRAVGGGVDAPTLDLYADSAQGLLYVSGWFRHAGDSTVAELATWDGNHWAKVGNYQDPPAAPGSDALIFSVLPYGNDVFVAGSFDWNNAVYRGEQMAYRYDGTNWDTCGNPDAPVLYTKVNGELFASGNFSEISGQLATGFAKWNGIAWVPFGDTLPRFRDNGSFVAAEYYQGSYYLGGNYDYGTRYKEIVYWDGHRWSSVGDGIPGQSWVIRMKVYHDLLYVGGYFHEAEGNADDMLMTWNGSEWAPTFPDVHFVSQIYDMEVIGGELYIAAGHYIRDGATWKGPYCIGRFNGTEFCSFGGIDNNALITDIAGLKGEIYVNVSNAIWDGDTVNYIAQWMGGNDMEACVSVPTAAVAASSQPSVKLYPNPCTMSFSLELPPSMVGCHIRLLDVAGREVVPSTGYFSGEFDVSGLPRGLYLLEIHSKTSMQVIKLVLE